MAFIGQLGIILTISFLGELLYTWLPFPIPASIYGLLLMLFVLFTGIIKLDQVAKTGDTLLAILPLLLIPGTVGLMTVFEELQSMLPAFLLVTTVGTALVMVVTGRLVQWLSEVKSK